MNASKMKNIIVLNDFPSNIVDEAIIILKDKIKIKESNLQNNNIEYKDEASGLAVKEAEMVINDYINNMEKGSKNFKAKNKYFKLSIFIIAITVTLGLIINLI